MTAGLQVCHCMRPADWVGSWRKGHCRPVCVCVHQGQADQGPQAHHQLRGGQVELHEAITLKCLCSLHTGDYVLGPGSGVLCFCILDICSISGQRTSRGQPVLAEYKEQCAFIDDRCQRPVYSCDMRSVRRASSQKNTVYNCVAGIGLIEFNV